MPRKESDPEEYKRFLETARKVGADQSEDVLGGALKKIAKHRPAAESKNKLKREK